MQRSGKIKRACLLVFLAIALIGAIYFFCVHRETEAFALPRKSVPLRISKETTFVLEPLRSDGKTIDFQCALEKQFTPSSSPEENGFREIAKTLGRRLFENISDEHWNELCEKLSLNPSDPPSLEYVGLVDHIKENLTEIPLSKRNDEAYRILFSYDKPIENTPEELEYLKSWLDKTEPVFIAVEQALKKPVYFIPPCRTDGRPDLTIGASVQRQILYLFKYRIVYRISVKEGSEAWNDVSSMYRSARLYSRQPFLNSIEMGVAYDGVASALAQRVLKSGLLDAGQLRQCLVDLDHLPELASFESKLDTERIGLLQCISELPEKGPAAFRIDFVAEPPFLGDSKTSKEILDGVEPHNKGVKEAIRIFRKIPFDWNIIAELVNAEYDEIRAKTTKEELFRRHPNWKKVYETEYEKPTSFRQFQKWSLEERSVVLASGFYDAYIPKRKQYDLVVARSTAALELARTMAALECFKLKAGHYPETLESLVEEKILSKIPDDPYRQNETASLIYRREAPDRYILYSVGINGVDNGGKHWKSDPPDSRDWDDVVVEML